MTLSSLVCYQQIEIQFTRIGLMFMLVCCRCVTHQNKYIYICSIQHTYTDTYTVGLFIWLMRDSPLVFCLFCLFVWFFFVCSACVMFRLCFANVKFSCRKKKYLRKCATTWPPQPEPLAQFAAKVRASSFVQPCRNNCPREEKDLESET